MSFLKKIQGLPIIAKKFILWFVVIVVAIGLFILFIRNVNQQVKNINKKDFSKKLELPNINKELRKLPEIKLPSANGYEK